MAGTAVIREYERLRDEIARLEERIEKKVGDLLREKQQKERQLRLLREYLELSGSRLTDGPQESSRGRSSGAARLALDAAVDVVSAAEQPLHYTDLYQRVASQGFQIPGEKPEANFLTHLNRDPRFMRVRPGTYTLREAVPPFIAAVNGSQASD